MISYDNWLNKGNPADIEVDEELLIEDLANDIDRLILEYEVMGLETETIIYVIKEMIR